MIESLYQQWYFERPELAKQIFAILVDGPGDPLALIGERRIGKTSHLRGELYQEARRRKFLPVYIDIQQHRSKPLAAIAYAFNEAIDDVTVPTTTVGKRLKTPVKKIGGGGISLDLGDEPTRRRPTDPYLLIDWLLKELIRVAGQPVLLIFDEIQELATASDSDNVVAALRSAITKSKQNIRVVFTGSSEIKLMELFSRSRAALYEGASTIAFPHLDDTFLQFIMACSKARFKRSANMDELRAAFDRLHHRPRALIDLVMLHASSDGSSLVDVLDNGVMAQLSNQDFHTQWAKLTPLQQRICLRISQGNDVSSANARAYYAKETRRNEIPVGTVGHALKALVTNHVVANTGRGLYRLDDPLFAEWIRKVLADSKSSSRSPPRE
jgi:uncharacterized protein